MKSSDIFNMLLSTVVVVASVYVMPHTCQFRSDIYYIALFTLLAGYLLMIKSSFSNKSSNNSATQTNENNTEKRELSHDVKVKDSREWEIGRRKYFGSSEEVDEDRDSNSPSMMRHLRKTASSRTQMRGFFSRKYSRQGSRNLGSSSNDTSNGDDRYNAGDSSSSASSSSSLLENMESSSSSQTHKNSDKNNHVIANEDADNAAIESVKSAAELMDDRLAAFDEKRSKVAEAQLSKFRQKVDSWLKEETSYVYNSPMMVNEDMYDKKSGQRIKLEGLTYHEYVKYRCKKFVTDDTLLRYLRARDGDLNDAFNALESTLKWRMLNMDPHAWKAGVEYYAKMRQVKLRLVQGLKTDEDSSNINDEVENASDIQQARVMKDRLLSVDGKGISSSSRSISAAYPKSLLKGVSNTSSTKKGKHTNRHKSSSHTHHASDSGGGSGDHQTNELAALVEVTDSCFSNHPHPLPILKSCKVLAHQYTSDTTKAEDKELEKKKGGGRGKYNEKKDIASNSFHHSHNDYHEDDEIMKERLKVLSDAHWQVWSPSPVCLCCRKDPSAHCFYRLGVDRVGRHVIYSCAARCRNRVVLDNMEHMAFEFERIFDHNSLPGKVVWVIDMKGFGLRDCNPAMASSALPMFGAHYPERMGQIVLIDPPAIFAGLWASVQPILDPVTKSKVVFLRGAAAFKAYADVQWRGIKQDYIDSLSHKSRINMRKQGGDIDPDMSMFMERIAGLPGSPGSFPNLISYGVSDVHPLGGGLRGVRASLCTEPFSPTKTVSPSQDEQHVEVCDEQYEEDDDCFLRDPVVTERLRRTIVFR